MVELDRGGTEERPADADELSTVLGKFSDARCILECAVRSLESWHGGETAVEDETVCLRHGLELLRAVYNHLDLCIGRLHRGHQPIQTGRGLRDQSRGRHIEHRSKSKQGL